MQVQHEARLLEPNTSSLPLGDDASANTNSPDLYSLAPQQSNILSPIERLACGGPSNVLLAAHLSQANQIVLFDSKSHQRRDRFPLKACDKKYSRHSFQVSALDFSRDGQRLAVGQTDCIIYIYKLAQVTPQIGSSATSTNQQTATDSPANPKPTTISGKFGAASPITCLIWSDLGILFGSQDGRVRLILAPGGQQRPSNVGFPAQNGAVSLSEPQPSQSATVAPRVIQLHQAPCISSVPIALSFKSPLLLIAQLDCKVNILVLASEQTTTCPQEPAANQSASSRRNSSVSAAPSVRQSLTISHSCPPLHVSSLASNTICCAGSDGRVAFHSVQLSHNSLTSIPLQTIDLKEDIQSADLSPINELLAVITRRRLIFIKFDQESNSWRLQPSLIEFRGLFGLSSVRWLRDGSQLALGHSNCALDLFRCNWQKQALNEQLDICHIARNRIRITDRERNLLATYKTQHDIKRVNILDRNQSVIIWTSSSLLLARLNCQLHSELGWPLSSSGKPTKSQPKFLFEPSGFVLIYFESTCDCHLIRLGDSHVRFSLNLPLAKRVRMSVRQFPPLTELCGSNQVGSSPSRLRSASSSHSARLDSAHSQCNSFANEPPTEDSLHLSGEQSSLRPINESQCERFAYISGEQQTQLNIVDLKKPAKLICSRYFEAPIASVKFSCTGSYLIVMESDQQERLHLIKIKENEKSHIETDVTVESKAILEKCHFADWLPETDALVVQIKWTIQIWFDLDEFKRVTRFDCRSFNYAKRSPLLDLSALSDRAKTYPRCQRVVCDTTNQSDFLILSNSQQIPLDRSKRKFYSELTLDKLESAFELLQKQPSDQQKSALFAKLGWKAIERGDCDLAIKIFTRIQCTSLVSYLVKCQNSGKCSDTEAEGEIELEPESGKRNESGLMIAKLRGDWRKFEQLASDQGLILATYKRLNKWTLCLDYLTRQQRFRQLDIAESERQQWLLGRGRFMEAAKSRVEHSGDLIGALEMLLEQKQFRDASDLMLSEQKTTLAEGIQMTQTDRRLCELADLLIRELTTSVDYFRAAQLTEKILAKEREAIDMYLRADKFREALDLAERVSDLDSEKRVEMHLKYARHLEDQAKRKLIGERRARIALEHFIQAGCQLDALEFAAEFGFNKEAREILQNHGQHLVAMKLQSDEKSRGNLLRRFQQAAEKFSSCRKEFDWELASKLFELAEEYEKMVELLIEAGELEQAFEITLKKVHGNNSQRTRARFMELAEQLASEPSDKQKLSRAERIYLLLGRPELAIEMYRKLELSDEMLELIARNQPDQLESSLLQLARSLESAGRLEEAERYLMRASANEWTGVVRMYRLAQRWPDAFRVARANCLSDEDPLLVQLAYWWAKSLVAPKVQSEEPQRTHEEGLAAARNLLIELRLMKQVIEFCCETKNYPFAIDLTSSHEQLTSLRRDIIVQYAAHLEGQEKFADAERVLIENRMVELATRLYLDNDQYQDAVRVIEQQLNDVLERDRPQLTELLNKTLVECGRRLAESLSSSFRRTPPIMRQRLTEETSSSSSSSSSSNLQLAQQMFLRAQRPELAIEMYQSLGLWQEAIQTAQRFAPRLLEDVERALDAQVSNDIEPILRSSRPGASMVASEPHQQSDKQRNGHLDETNAPSTNSSSTGKAADELWRQLCDQLSREDRREARPTLAKYLSSLLSVERDFELGRHLQQLANAVADSSSWLAITLSQQDNMTSLSRLSDKLFLKAEWTSGAWPGLAGLLTNCYLASQTSGEFDIRMQRRCIVALHIATYGALEDLLREFLSGPETRSGRALLSTTGGPLRQSGALFGRKSRRAAINKAAVDKTSAALRGAAPIWLTIKQVERLLERANGPTGRSQRIPLTVDLLAKLSFGLLRNADQLDVAHLLLVAGRWQLALGRRKVARDLWTSLIELLDGVDESRELHRATPNSLRSSVGHLVDLPDSLMLPLEATPKRDGEKQQQIAEVRQWLLESLIDGPRSNGPAAPELPVGWAKLGPDPICLVSALAANQNQTIVPSNRGLGIRRAEFMSICELTDLKLDAKRIGEPIQIVNFLQDVDQNSGTASQRLRQSTKLAVNLVAKLAT